MTFSSLVGLNLMISMYVLNCWTSCVLLLCFLFLCVTVVEVVTVLYVPCGCTGLLALTCG